MYAESQSNKQKKPYNLKKEAIKGGAAGLASLVLVLGIGLAFKPTIRGDLLETVLIATAVAPIITGVGATISYTIGYMANLSS